MSNRKRDERGAALVEFALIVPVLVMLLMGLIECGRAYNMKLAVEAAAREGARELALNYDDADHGVAAARTEAMAADGVANLQTNEIQPVACPPPTQTGPRRATVNITKQFTFHIPLIPTFVRELKGTGVMRCGL
jgi:Flp pilus assembly protein TadG